MSRASYMAYKMAYRAWQRSNARKRRQRQTARRRAAVRRQPTAPRRITGRLIAVTLGVFYSIVLAHITLQALYDRYGWGFFVGLGAAVLLYVQRARAGRCAVWLWHASRPRVRHCAAWLWRTSLPAWPVVGRWARAARGPLALLAAALGTGLVLGYLCAYLLSTIFGPPTPGGM